MSDLSAREAIERADELVAVFESDDFDGVQMTPDEYERLRREG